MQEPRSGRPAMPAYGVDGEGWEALPWSWAAERLLRSRNYWVVTVSAAGRPHALPVWGVWDDEAHRFAFSCAPSSRKAANLTANPAVVVAPDDTVECVSLEGRAHLVDRDDDREAWVERYVAKYRPVLPSLDPDFVRSNAIVEVVPEKVFGIIEREEEFAARATRWVFDGT